MERRPRGVRNPKLRGCARGLLHKEGLPLKFGPALRGDVSNRTQHLPGIRNLRGSPLTLHKRGIHRKHPPDAFRSYICPTAEHAPEGNTKASSPAAKCKLYLFFRHHRGYTKENPPEAGTFWLWTRSWSTKKSAGGRFYGLLIISFRVLEETAPSPFLKLRLISNAVATGPAGHRVHAEIVDERN